MPSLIQPLFDGPLDIVGDVHGEIDALRSLMIHLGYGGDGEHLQGRRLVFLGDLTDRGPDSPAVVELVSTMIDAGKAQCVLGNHDLNILLDHPKLENRWFYGEEFVSDGQVIPQRLADLDTQKRVLDFFASLPLAIEGDDLRIVHACWNDEMLTFVRDSSNVLSLYHEHADRIELDVRSRPTLDAIDKELLRQNQNPVKQVTSGPEKRTEQPITAGGKVRYEERVRWWESYQGAFCVFGHYGFADGAPRGNDSAFCVDFGVGNRWKERRTGKSSGFYWKLAALRYPEMEVVFDEGGRSAENKDEQHTKKSFADTLRDQAWNVNSKSGGGCVITGVKPEEVNRSRSQGLPE